MKKHKQQLGFTLIETIISITILAVAIIGPMTLSSQSIRASRDARLHLEAIHLAEEGVEIVRNVRDNYSAGDTNADRNRWDDGLLTCAAGCKIDPTSHQGNPESPWGSGALQSMSGGCTVENTTCSAICFDATTGLYAPGPSGACTGGSLVASPFTRQVTTTQVAGKPQIRVTSVVAYRSVYGNQMKYATATDDIYNWFPCMTGVCPP